MIQKRNNNLMLNAPIDTRPSAQRDAISVADIATTDEQQIVKYVVVPSATPARSEVFWIVCVLCLERDVT
jgi:hypothetical protein